jgi:hypothetical protein
LKQTEKNEKLAATMREKKQKPENSPIKKQINFVPDSGHKNSEAPSYNVDEMGEINIAKIAEELDTDRHSIERSRTFSKRSKSNRSISVSPDFPVR